MRKKILLPLRTDPVVILGMHRSGTTLLTRILSRLGIFMGHRLQVTNEPIFFRDLDNKLLSIAQAAWDMHFPKTKNLSSLMIRLKTQGSCDVSAMIVPVLSFAKTVEKHLPC